MTAPDFGLRLYRRLRQSSSLAFPGELCRTFPFPIRKLCQSANVVSALLQTVDGVRPLQELAFEEYVGRVAEPDRADSAGGVYEAVSRWKLSEPEAT